MIEIGIFKVTYVGPKNVVPDCIDDTNIQDYTIPIFTRIRTVTVDPCGTMSCSCCYLKDKDFHVHTRHVLRYYVMSR